MIGGGVGCRFCAADFGSNAFLKSASIENDYDIHQNYYLDECVDQTFRFEMTDKARSQVRRRQLACIVIFFLGRRLGLNEYTTNQALNTIVF